MATMTAITITSMHELTTDRSKHSARKLVWFHKAKGTRTKPTSEVSLNSRMQMNICPASAKKARMTTNHAMQSTAISIKLLKKSIGTTNSFACKSSGQAASKHIQNGRAHV